MMHTIYDLVSGPLVWVAFVLFIGGSLYRILSMAMLARKKDGIVYEYWSFKYALRSILRWLTPFGTVNMRKKPVMTFVAFVFHICAVLAPIFLYAHMIMVKEALDFGWWSIPDAAADVMTLIVILGCIFFLFRRITQREVRYLTTASDFVLLLVVAAPFITGFWAFHQLPGSAWVTVIHMLCGEIMLAAIPFTRLSHMIFFPFTRGYIGSEFGAVRFARDW
jgi:nitrate reductase gamma subunit